MEPIYLICIIRLGDSVKISFIGVYVYCIILAISEGYTWMPKSGWGTYLKQRGNKGNQAKQLLLF